ncbi:MAG TPA: LuxR C-terminal-related transcriptional regulator [Umezawaea sp.]|nr:LuxR C-terminal-related transcriptional regulator [Umezawaea sp.]
MNTIPRHVVPGRQAGRAEDSADFLGSLAERAGLCMVRLDRGLQVIKANDNFRQQFRHSQDDLKGRSLYEFLHPKVHARMRFQFRHLTEGRHTWFAERVVAMCPGVSAFDSELTCVSGRNVASGGPVITVLLKTESARPPGEREIGGDDLLSEQSARVLERIAVGESTPEIAAGVMLSRQGVEYHIGSMLRRFNVPNRAALVSRAFSAGILTGETWPPRVLAEYVK